MLASLTEKNIIKKQIKFITTNTKRNLVKRISPFLLLFCFITFFWLPYLVITRDPRLFQLIIPGVVAAYALFADFFIWNLFEGKKKWLIWLIESTISSLVILWLTWIRFTAFRCNLRSKLYAANINSFHKSILLCLNCFNNLTFHNYSIKLNGIILSK